MSMMNAPIRRSGGDIDVYTGLLFAAFVVLLTGTVAVAMANMRQTESPDRTMNIQAENVLFGVPGFEVIN